MSFEKATKEGAYLRMGLVGPSGSGKSFSALAIADIFGDNTVVLDSERGSSKIYASDFDFFRDDIDDFSPDGYTKAIGEAWKFIKGKKLKNPVVIIDGISQEWSGKGGALELKDKAAARSSSKNTFFAWRDITPAHNRFIDTMLRLPCHLIVTMRAKSEVVIENVNGKQVPKVIGIAPVQRHGIEFELNVMGEMDLDHNLKITNTRYSLIDGQTIHQPGGHSDKLFPQFAKWLSADPVPDQDFEVPEVESPNPNGAGADPLREMARRNVEDPTGFGLDGGMVDTSTGEVIQHPEEMTQTEKRNARKSR